VDNQWTVAAAFVTQLGIIAGLISTIRQSRSAAHQLARNSGSTVADAVNRIEQRVDGISEDIGEVRKEQDHLRKRFDSHIDGRSPRRRKPKEES
jgi:hypothetical protein